MSGKVRQSDILTALSDRVLGFLAFKAGSRYAEIEQSCRAIANTIATAPTMNRANTPFLNVLNSIRF
jgi:hypothetical protein